MPPSAPPPSDPTNADDEQSGTSPVDDMRRADIVNGENPDEEGSSYPTGERQARKNRENDPPA